jgi:hypothetical protein
MAGIAKAAARDAAAAKKNDPEPTARDLFACCALIGLLAAGDDYRDNLHPQGGWDWFAKASYSMADAMLAHRRA